MTTKAFLAHVEMKLSAAKMENMFIRYAAGVGGGWWQWRGPHRTDEYSGKHRRQ